MSKQHFDCPHCHKQIDVFDEAEAKREALMQSEHGKREAEMSTKILATLQGFRGVKILTQDRRPTRFDDRDCKHVVLESEHTIYDFDSGAIPGLFSEIIAKSRTEFARLAIPSGQYVRPTLDQWYSLRDWAIEIDDHPCRFILYYAATRAGWQCAIDARYRAKPAEPVDPFMKLWAEKDAK
jgi:hypothetical protein